MPATLEVTETPPKPLGRILSITIGVFFALAILWASLGTTDIISIAEGRVIPIGQIKTVQPLETGIVRQIHIEDGQEIDAGATLIELDTTEVNADFTNTQISLTQAELDLAVSEALLAKDVTKLEIPADVPETLQQLAKSRVEVRLARLNSTLRAIEEEINQTNSNIEALDLEKESIVSAMEKIEELLVIQQGLFEKQLAQRSQIISLNLELTTRQSALDRANAEQRRLRFAVKSLQARAAEQTATFEAEATEQRNAALTRIEGLTQELDRQTQRLKNLTLNAPVAGTVQELEVHTIGAVVTSSQPIMKIVPKDTPLQIEAQLLNRDIGFVEVGQEVEIKFEAFPFTRYGVAHGELVQISRDAVIDQVMGPVFDIRVKMNKQTIRVDGQEVPIVPGMRATAEIKTGKRRIIEFFLSPLLRYRDEAIRER